MSGSLPLNPQTDWRRKVRTSGGMGFRRNSWRIDLHSSRLTHSPARPCGDVQDFFEAAAVVVASVVVEDSLGGNPNDI